MVTLKQVIGAVERLGERRGSSMKQIRGLLKAEAVDRAAPPSGNIRRAVEKGFRSGRLERTTSCLMPRYRLRQQSERPIKSGGRSKTSGFTRNPTKNKKRQLQGFDEVNHCRYCCCCKVMKYMQGKAARVTVVVRNGNNGRKKKQKSKIRKTGRKTKSTRQSRKTNKKSKTKDGSMRKRATKQKSKSKRSQKSQINQPEENPKSGMPPSVGLFP